MAQIPSFIEYVRYCYKLVDYLEQHPGEDYTSELVQKLNAEHPEGLSKDNIAVALFGFLMAGHETTANALAWTWYLLACDPRVEARLHDELKSVAVRQDDGTPGR